MRLLLPQLVRALWIVLTVRLLCEGKPFASKENGANVKEASGILTGKALLSGKFYETPKFAPFQMKDEGDYEDEALGDEDDIPREDAGSTEDDEMDYGTTESYESEDDESETLVDFDDPDFALEAISEGAVKSTKSPGGESYVPCFGMWWPVNGGVGYDYIYTDYGGGDYGTNDEGDYTDGRRRKRKRARRMRSRKKAAKRKRRRRNKAA